MGTTIQKNSKHKHEPVARMYVVSGRVQGVGYRAFAQKVARELVLTGWVRNLADGDVEAYAAGSLETLDEFDGRLRMGPSMSEVRSVHTTDAAVSGATGFHIR